MNTPSCVVNPKTGRAVKASGKIGKMILAEKKDKPAAKSADKPKVNTMYKDAKAVRPNRTDFEKKPKINTMYKDAKKVRPNRADYENKPVKPAKEKTPEKPAKEKTPEKPVKEKTPEKPAKEKTPEKIEKKNISKSLEALVDEWNTETIAILFSQMGQENEKVKNMITKINNIKKQNAKGKSVFTMPSDLFAFYPELLNELVEHYGATKKAIDIIDERLRQIILYFNNEANIVNYRDYKYYTKYMNAANKRKFKNVLIKNEEHVLYQLDALD